MGHAAGNDEPKLYDQTRSTLGGGVQIVMMQKIGSNRRHLRQTNY